MNKIITVFYFIILFCHFSIAGDNTPLGARSSGLANASVSLVDIWSVQNNQAGLGFVRDISAGVFYDNRFMLKELSMRAGAFAFPVKGGTFGLCVSNFGYSLYSESKYGLAFGKAFGDKFSAGIQIDYITTKISEYGTKSVPAAEFGLQAKPLKNLIIGVHVFNLTKAKLVSYNDERIPTIMRLGFNYKFSEKVFLAGETEKDIDKKAIIKVGLEYRPIKELYFRAGIATNPSLSCFGIGVVLKNFRLDLSSTYHSVFGLSPQIGLNYIFETAKKTESPKSGE